MKIRSTMYDCRSSYTNALCDTGFSVRIISGDMAEFMRLKIKPSLDTFTFVDFSSVNSGGIVNNVHVEIGYVIFHVEIGNAIFPLDFH